MSEQWYPDNPPDLFADDKKEIKAKIKNRLSNLNVIYKREMSSVVDIYVGNEGNEVSQTKSGHSQYLALYIVRTDTGDVVKLRMSTVRNIFKFLSKKEFVPEPRRLTPEEKT